MMYLSAEDSARDIQSMKPRLEECWFLAGEVEHYSREQMREVYAGVVGYHTARAIKLYSSHELSATQMHEIRMGIEDGLSCEAVLAYSDKAVPFQIMHEIRKALVASKRAGATVETRSDALRLLIGAEGR